MMIIGFALMSMWLWIVGAVQGAFGHWDDTNTWVITGHPQASKAIIASSYLFVCSFAVTIGPTSWT